MGKAEAEVEGYLIQRVKALGGETRKAQWIGRRGCPDRRVMLPDRPPFWAECKSQLGDLDDHQVREIARMMRLGETVFVLSSRFQIDQLLGKP